MRLLLHCIFLAATIHAGLGARILAVLPVPVRSHHHLFRAVLRTVAERGHEVVSYTSMPMDKAVVNYTEILLDTITSSDVMFSQGQLLHMKDSSPLAGAIMMWKEVVRIIPETFKCEKFKQLVASNEKFDLVFLEASVAQEPLLGLGHKFNAPVINMHPFGSFSLVNKLSGNSLSLSNIPDFSLSHSNHMTFYERLLNSYSILRTLHFYYNDYLPTIVDLTRDFYKDPTMPSVINMAHNGISLFINNAHPYVHYAQPYTPNLIPIGGIHLEKEQKPLPQAMKKFLDEAKHGAIYFSLGTVIPDQLLPQVFFDNFINVFQRLPQRILWKTNYAKKGLPDNVMISKWVPQQDVLAHPNSVLFLTHGGLFSQHEAINAAVPVVCIPYLGDQPMNARFYEEKEVGVTLLFNTLSEKTIHSAITTVLENPKYKENMQRLSRVYRDYPISPADTLVFWAEYVMRHRGASHLRSSSVALSWYQLALLDVLAVILLSVTLTAVLVYLIIRTTVRFLAASGKPVRDQSYRGKKMN